ncbi:small basic family protein [Pectinatus cerevisiiphilus]|uniref:Small basic protein n=1 Tax=Pectinatus cerevisiiphilus TaxID=86956 RepID=A0A4R3KCM3_9FIRM|nr:small basic family protein [Pectinatus cerevisiiphilus]TCS80867.1 small basic protein [Pectinatus cerevisiiphilus]
MIFAIISLIIGAIVGYFCNVTIPGEYSKLFSVALLAGFDAVFGGLKAVFIDTFDNINFLLGFFLNTILAVLMVFLGDNLSIELYYVVLFVFALRIFKNLSYLRHRLIKK